MSLTISYISNVFKNVFSYPVFVYTTGYFLVYGVFRFGKYLVTGEKVKIGHNEETIIVRRNLYAKFKSFIAYPTLIQFSIYSLLTFIYPPPELTTRRQVKWVLFINLGAPLIIGSICLLFGAGFLLGAFFNMAKTISDNRNNGNNSNNQTTEVVNNSAPVLPQNNEDNVNETENTSNSAGPK